MSRMICQAEAPSTLAAVIRSLGIASMAEVKMIIPKEAPTKPLTKITNTHGVVMYGVNSKLLDCTVPSQTCGGVYEVAFSFRVVLAPGRYFLTVGVARPSGEIHDRRADVLDFEVAGSFAGYTTSHVDLDADVSVRTLTTDVSLEPAAS